jgi:molybdenum cofactor biosynthesis enzyme MoaA
MVLKITDICNMGCTHCLSDCTMTPHIKDFMDEDTYDIYLPI